MSSSVFHLPLSDAVHATVSAASAAASLNTGVIANNNAITFTAVAAGVLGNAISVALVVAGNNTPLTVGVSGNAITVNVATSGGGVATSTGTQVIAAIAASPAAAALVSAANQGASTGAGVVVAQPQASLSGGATPGLVDMRGYESVAFLLLSSGSTVGLTMADTPLMANAVTVVSADTGVPVQMLSGSPTPYWLEIYRPTKTWVQAAAAPVGTIILRYRHSGFIPLLFPQNRTFARAS